MEVYRVPDAPPPANPVFMDIGDSGWFPAQLTPTRTLPLGGYHGRRPSRVSSLQS